MHPNIQSEILAAVLKGEYSDKEVLHYTEPGFFTVDSYQWLLKTLKSRKWESIAWEYIDPLLQESFSKDPDKIEVYRNQIWTLYQRDLTFKDDAVRDFIQFVAVSKAKAAIKDSFDAFEKSNRADFLFHSLKKEILQAESVISGNKIEVVDYAAGFKERMDQRIYMRDNPDVNPVIKMGFKEFDTQFEVKGEMMVNFLAPFKSYKSIFLNDITAVGAMQGFNGAHVILENSTDLTQNRYDAFFNQINYNRLKAGALTSAEFSDINTRMEWIDSWFNRIKIIKGISKKTTIYDVEDHLDRLEEQEGFVPDFITLDYANIFACSDKSIREENRQQAQIMWDMKYLLEKRKCPMFTATQTNQEGNKTVRNQAKGEPVKKRVDSSHQGKAIDISQAVDISIAINQTADEKEENIIMLEPLIVRDGEIKQREFYLNCDIPRMMVSRDMDYMYDIARKVHNL